MLRTRLWMGAVLIALAIGLLVVDRWLEPWFPFLFLVVLGLGLTACHELLHLLGPSRRLPAWLCYLSVGALVGANWLAPVLSPWFREANPWPWIASVYVAVLLTAFLREMAVFHEPGDGVVRMALIVWLASYVGFLPSFFIQLRWLTGPDGFNHGTEALALAIFVPKCGDIGAYFTGRLIGKHPMTPLLSPKKTWEGALGNVAAAVFVAVVIELLAPVLKGGWPTAVAFGISVGVAAMLGDLAESLIKRDCQRKDASQAVPGFGGVLDVVDSVMFSAPVAYWWLK